MENGNDYLSVNKECWNKRTDQHVASEFYDLDTFVKGSTSLKSIETEMLGNIKDKKILHLQCHFGQDSLSMARMGAKVTGVDFSDKAISKAKELNEVLGLDAEFICCDIYSLPEYLNDSFDIVFTTYGTIGWLPDMNRWAAIVARYLKPQGQLVFVEFHPFIWMYDNAISKIQYSYFNVETIEETEEGTYADKDAPIETKSIGWNHPVSEVVNALIGNGLTIKVLDEFDYSPYNVFPGMEESENGRFRFINFGNKFPLVYSINAFKNPD